MVERRNPLVRNIHLPGKQAPAILPTAMRPRIVYSEALHTRQRCFSSGYTEKHCFRNRNRGWEANLASVTMLSRVGKRRNIWGRIKNLKCSRDNVSVFAQGLTLRYKHRQFVETSRKNVCPYLDTQRDLSRGLGPLNSQVLIDNLPKKECGEVTCFWNVVSLELVAKTQFCRWKCNCVVRNVKLLKDMKRGHNLKFLSLRLVAGL